MKKIFLALIILFLPNIVYASNNTKLTLNCIIDDYPIAGMNINAYKIYSADINGSSFNFEKESSFNSFSVDSEELINNFSNYTSIIENYIEYNDIYPNYITTMDENGQAIFDLEPGIYYIIGQDETSDRYTYKFHNFGIIVPIKTSDGSMSYEITSNVKISEIYQPPIALSIYTNNNELFLTTSIGIGVLLIGIFKFTNRKK